MPFEDQLAPADSIQDTEPNEPLPEFLVCREDQPTLGDTPFDADPFAEELQFVDGEIMEEQIVTRMKGDAEFPGPGEGLR